MVIIDFAALSPGGALFVVLRWQISVAAALGVYLSAVEHRRNGVVAISIFADGIGGAVRTVEMAGANRGEGPLIGHAGDSPVSLSRRWQGFVDVYPFRFSFVADHFQYLASAVLISLFASGVAMVWERMDSRGRSIGAVVIAFMLVIWGVLTWNQAHVYQNLETLWQDTVTKNPQCWLAHNNLGSALLQEGRGSEALAHYEKALRLKPDYADAHFNLALVLADMGKPAEAASQFKDGLRVEPDNAKAQKDVGGVLMQLRENKEAVEHWEKALQLRPDYPKCAKRPKALGVGDR